MSYKNKPYTVISKNKECNLLSRLSCQRQLNTFSMFSSSTTKDSRDARLDNFRVG